MSNYLRTPNEPIHSEGFSRENKTTNSLYGSSGRPRETTARDKLTKHRLEVPRVDFNKTRPERETSHITASNPSGPLGSEAKRTLMRICEAFHSRNNSKASPSSITMYLLWADMDGLDFAIKAAKCFDLPFQPSRDEFFSVLSMIGISYIE